MSATPWQWCSRGLAASPIDVQGRSWVVFDTETTGLQPARDHITQFAAIVIDGQGVESARAVWRADHGAARLREVVGSLDDAVGDGIAVAHNLAFDLRMLNADADLRGCALLTPANWLCTMRLTGRRTSLDDLAAQVGVPVHGRHTALGDAHALSLVLDRLIEAARRRDQAAVSGIALVCPVASEPPTFASGDATVGWGAVRAALDLVVPAQMASLTQRDAVRSCWDRLESPSGGPQNPAVTSQLSTELARVGVSAVMLDRCLAELMPPAAGQAVDRRDT